jgi:diguanylate cyclase (GGDEF)-like protein
MPLAFGEETLDKLATSHPSGRDRAEAEWRELGIDHAYIGAMFADQAGLDPELVAAIAWHHGGRRVSAGPTQAIACVQLANIVVAMLAGEPADHVLLDEALEVLSLQPDALDALAESQTQNPDAIRAGLGNRVAELERLASTDELTGLANRRHWMSSVRRAIGDGQAGSVMLCDLDCFKQVNDEHGHATGDVVLTEIARILAKHGDAGRLGGDEFAVWFQGEDAGVAADAIVDEVAAAFPDRDRLPVSVSIGVAPGGIDLSSALERADRALYAAKASGRRCARHADSLKPELLAEPRAHRAQSTEPLRQASA